jgi:hypothetical protein
MSIARASRKDSGIAIALGTGTPRPKPSTPPRAATSVGTSFSSAITSHQRIRVPAFAPTTTPSSCTSGTPRCLVHAGTLPKTVTAPPAPPPTSPLRRKPALRTRHSGLGVQRPLRSRSVYLPAVIAPVFGFRLPLPASRRVLSTTRRCGCEGYNLQQWALTRTICGARRAIATPAGSYPVATTAESRP